MMDERPHDSPDSPPPTEEPVGFSKLSRQLARRTTDLIGVAILAIGLLAVGGKIGRWWNTDPQKAVVTPESSDLLLPWDTHGEGISLEWGDLNYGIHHQVIQGDSESAGDQLEKIVIVKSTKITTPHFPATEAEVKLLAELKAIPATRPLESGTKLYRFDSQLPMVILTKPVTSQPNSTDSENHRVVCWGRAFPQSPNQWMLFLFHTPGANTSSVVEETTIPLPDGSRMIQQISDASGQSWTAFRGQGSVEEGQRHFDRWFQEHDWRRLRDWTKIGSAWSARFQSQETGQNADIWFYTTGTDLWNGMVFLSPLKSVQSED